jgi:large subunit ribosomal protein L21
MFAVIETGGKQYRVVKDSVIKVEKIDTPIGNQIELDKVLCVSDENNLTTGTPYVQGIKIKATVLDQGKGKKIRVFKMKHRKRYRRTQGHRQFFTKLRVDEIVNS